MAQPRSTRPARHTPRGIEAMEYCQDRHNCCGWSALFPFLRVQDIFPLQQQATYGVVLVAIVVVRGSERNGVIWELPTRGKCCREVTGFVPARADVIAELALHNRSLLYLVHHPSSETISARTCLIFPRHSLLRTMHSYDTPCSAKTTKLQARLGVGCISKVMP